MPLVRKILYQTRADPVPLSFPVTTGRFAPTFVQPRKIFPTVAYLTAGGVVPVLVPFPAELVPPPAFVQPSRAVRYAPGTTTALPIDPIRNALFREALAAHLAADSSVAAVVGARIYHLTLPQYTTFPALLYRVVSWPRRPIDLSGPLTSPTARVQITAVSRDPGECDLALEAVRQSLQGYRGALGGSSIVVLQSVADNEADLYSDPGDNTSRAFARVSVDYLIRFREPRPSRLS